MNTSYRDLKEEELIESLVNNDRKAFEYIFRYYYTDLCRFTLKYVRDEIVAEEIVQEVFINIWERRSSIKINTSLKAYLFTAVRNRSFNYIKLQLPKEQLKTDVDSIGFIDENTREDELIMEDLHQYVREAIDTLPTKCKAIFLLSRNSGLTYKEIAEELEISVKTVENQVGLALKKLREQLNPIWDKVFFILLFLNI